MWGWWVDGAAFGARVLPGSGGWCCRVGGLGLVGRGLCVRVWGWGVEVGQCWCVLLGLVGWGWSGVVWVSGLRWSVVGCTFGFEVGGLGLVGRSLRLRVWGWWVEMVSGGLCVWVWGWWVGVGLGLVRGGLCMRVWGRWVGVGQWLFVRVGLKLVGWGWSVGVCA